MFSNNFVVCVMIDGKCLEEDRAGNVKIPFDSEYSIFLKNKHDRRATADVKIDGQSVGTFVVDSNSSFELKRPSNVNKSFRFVHIDSNDAKKDGKSRKSDGTNGLIEVEWKLEFKQEKVTYIPYPAPIPYYPSRPSRSPEPYRWDDQWTYEKSSISWNGNPNDVVRTSGMTASSSSGRGLMKSFNAVDAGPAESYEHMNGILDSGIPQVKDEVGATVEGKTTSQFFVTTSVHTESVSTTMRLSLKGFDVSKEELAKAKKRTKALVEIELLRARLNELEKNI